MSGINLLLSDARGVYIPRDFVQNFDNWETGLIRLRDLSDPSNEYYWDTWEQVLNDAYFVDASGNKWVLYQDGDLWAICYELLTDEERANFGFDD